MAENERLAGAQNIAAPCLSEAPSALAETLCSSRNRFDMARNRMPIWQLVGYAPAKFESLRVDGASHQKRIEITHPLAKGGLPHFTPSMARDELERLPNPRPTRGGLLR